MGENLRLTNDLDSIEIIEENIDLKKAQQICKKLLKHQDTIWCFQLRMCKIENIILEKILKYLQDCNQLFYLNLSIDVIDSFEKVKILSSYVQYFSNLTNLCLHSSTLEDDGLLILYEALKNNQKLTALDIGECNLTDASASIINNFIYTKSESQKGLTELILSGNTEITPNGWSEILIGIASCSDLKHLYIDYNNLTDLCGYLLVTLIASNEKLEIIDLESTGLTDKSAKLFERVIRNYPISLKKLNLLNNNISSKIIRKIDTMLSDEDLNPFEISLKNIEEKIQPVNPKEVVLREKTPEEKSLVKKVQDILLGNHVQSVKSIDSINNIEIVKNNDLKTEKENENEELLKPYDDFRFKAHSVLPFNLMN